MTDDAIELLLTMLILMGLVLWLPALEMCRNATRRVRRERAWRKFEAEGRGVLQTIEGDLAAGGR